MSDKYSDDCYKLTKLATLVEMVCKIEFKEALETTKVRLDETQKFLDSKNINLMD